MGQCFYSVVVDFELINYISYGNYHSIKDFLNAILCSFIIICYSYGESIIITSVTSIIVPMNINLNLII